MALLTHLLLVSYPCFFISRGQPAFYFRLLTTYPAYKRVLNNVPIVFVLPMPSDGACASSPEDRRWHWQ